MRAIKTLSGNFIRFNSVDKVEAFCHAPLWAMTQCKEHVKNIKINVLKLTWSTHIEKAFTYLPF